MPRYRTPGVYVEEISIFPPSITPVETSVPVFIGYSQKHVDLKGRDLKNVPHKITSIIDFEDCYGHGIPENLDVKLTQEISSSGDVSVNSISISGNSTGVPTAFLHYAIQMYFDNGGGSCFVMSIGQKPEIPGTDPFAEAIDLLKSLDEPTLIAIPDICLLSSEKYGEIVDIALRHCATNGNRMLILDVPEAYQGKNETNSAINANFRSSIVLDVKYLKHCATYFPYLETTYPYDFDDDSVTITSHVVKSKNSQGISQSNVGAFKGLTLAEANLKEDDINLYNAIIAQLRQTEIIIPPSGAITGAIVKNDTSRGVWKAPANISLSFVLKPAISISSSFQRQLNIDPSGKSINAIRKFTSRGTLIWGARTLAGNDNEWRYIPVVRFFMFAQRSIKKGTEQFVFDPNDASTWSRVRSTVENFLNMQWRAGALQGAKPDEAFYVRVGLNQTMTRTDILNNRMIIEIGMAIVRPAEFIVVKLVKKMVNR